MSLSICPRPPPSRPPTYSPSPLTPKSRPSTRPPLSQPIPGPESPRPPARRSPSLLLKYQENIFFHCRWRWRTLSGTGLVFGCCCPFLYDMTINNEEATKARNPKCELLMLVCILAVQCSLKCYLQPSQSTSSLHKGYI